MGMLVIWKIRFGWGSVAKSRRGSSKVEQTYGVSINKYNKWRELSLFEIGNMMMDKAQNEICKKLKEWSLVNAKSANTERKRKNKK